MANYAVPNVDLTIQMDRKVIPEASRGITVSDICALDIPAGAVGHTWLHIGRKGAPIPLKLAGQNFHVEPPETDGVYITTDAALPGLVLTLLVGITVRADA